MNFCFEYSLLDLVIIRGTLNDGTILRNNTDKVEDFPTIVNSAMKNSRWLNKSCETSIEASVIRNVLIARTGNELPKEENYRSRILVASRI